MKPTAGILPIFGRGRLSLPYPAEMLSVEPGRLVIDYAIEQMKAAGITHIYLVCLTKDLDWISPILSFERRNLADYQGVTLEYVEVKAGDPENWSYFALRGCLKASWSRDFTNLVILNPMVWIQDSQFLAKMLRAVEPSVATEIPGCYYLTEEDARKLRTITKRGGNEREAWEEVLGTRKYKETSPYLNLAEWRDLYQFIGRLNAKAV